MFVFTGTKRTNQQTQTETRKTQKPVERVSTYFWPHSYDGMRKKVADRKWGWMVFRVKASVRRQNYIYFPHIEAFC